MHRHVRDTAPEAPSSRPARRLAIAAALSVLVSMTGCPTTHTRQKDARRMEGVACGDVRCEGDEVCCNSSCNLCTPPGGGCVAVVCE